MLLQFAEDHEAMFHQQPALRVSIPLFRRFAIPLDGLRDILCNAISEGICFAHKALRVRVSLRSSLLRPFHRHSSILLSSITPKVTKGKIELRLGVTQKVSRCGTIPIGGNSNPRHSSCNIFSYALAI